MLYGMYSYHVALCILRTLSHVNCLMKGADSVPVAHLWFYSQVFFVRKIGRAINARILPLITLAKIVS